MDEAPRQAVTSHILAGLVSPQADCVKSVTLQYQVMPAAVAARTIEAEVQASAFRRAFTERTGRDATARDSADASRAAQAAREEAAGAGLVMLGLYTTVSVPNEPGYETRLARAVSVTEAAADASLIRFRKAWGSQAAVFATGLPCGICPPDMARRRMR
jgi:hypothetical protein